MLLDCITMEKEAGRIIFRPASFQIFAIVSLERSNFSAAAVALPLYVLYEASIFRFSFGDTRVTMGFTFNPAFCHSRTIVIPLYPK